ncbi:SCO1 protein [Methylacidimicrobium cyclopophantes]|uniref:SCO1 protein n=1 Tax=Methylacidimicrobium cyclopophantes TaxID=1041766 RepID=A0A5E6M8P9_9BACT|nr:SCO family protein [Methylacidimicrobium cyclopophantes]VVM05566.1 SCO1 protein [Methylacidimicrobium cyclopophantes]
MNQSKTNTLGGLCVLALLLEVLEPSRDPRAEASLPMLQAVDGFSLVDASGKPFRLENLRGKIFLLHFFHADCPGPCRLQALRLERLSMLLHSLRHVVLVSVTLDPERDTPEVLRSYAAAHHAIPGRWVFLTGPGTRFLQTTLDLPVAETAPEERAQYGRFRHATRLYLVDEKGWIRRCYYGGLHPQIPEQVAKDIRALLQERAYSPLR